MDILSNWNDGLNIEKTKDMKLSPQFNHLFKQTEFAITDFIYVRDFYSEINFLICIVASAKVLFKLIKRKVVGVG